MKITVWRTKDGKDIPIDKMDDKHLDNTIAMLEKSAKKSAYLTALSNTPKEQQKQFIRDIKLKRILNEEDFELIWEPLVIRGYWELIYERRKRQNILFR